MAEWLNAAVLKTVKDVSPSGVRIPVSPQMFYTYIIKSLKDGTYYKGSSSDLDKRLLYHNSGKSRYTKSHRPWVLHYSESFLTKTASLKRELFFKSIDGYNWLKLNNII